MQRDLIVSGNIGEAGAALLAAQEPLSIIRRFPAHFLTDKVNSLIDFYTDNRVFEKEKQTGDVIDTVLENFLGDDAYILKIGKNGLLRALWDIGEEMLSGFVVEADKIPVTQVTIELCELFGADPYKADSTGCFIICSSHGLELCRELAGQEVSAVIIGHTDGSNAKKIIFGDIIRFVDKPRAFICHEYAKPNYEAEKT